MTRDLGKLIERVEESTVSSNELNKAIAAPFSRKLKNGMPTCAGYVPWGDFSGNVDAAIRLVQQERPGWQWGVTWNNCQGALCHVEDNANSYEGSTGARFEATAATPALALVLALLRSLQSEENSNE